MAVILITHDLGIVADIARKIVVMYSGKVVVTGSHYDIFYNPKQPYTQALLSAIPIPDPRVEETKTALNWKASFPAPSIPRKAAASRIAANMPATAAVSHVRS